MAWTKSNVARYNEGNGRVIAMKLTANAAEDTITTGLSVIDYFCVGAVSLTSGAPKIYANSGSTGTAIAGALGCSGFTSGDVLFVKVFGR